jgi:hypothetical protein
MRVILEVTEETYDPFIERTVGEIRDDGSLRISYEYKKEDEDFWRTWQDMGASLSPTALTKLKELLEERCPTTQSQTGLDTHSQESSP